MVTEVQEGCRHIQRGVASTSKNVQGFAGRVTSEVRDSGFQVSYSDLFNRQPGFPTQPESIRAVQVQISHPFNNPHGHSWNKGPEKIHPRAKRHPNACGSTWISGS